MVSNVGDMQKPRVSDTVNPEYTPHTRTFASLTGAFMLMRFLQSLFLISLPQYRPRPRSPEQPKKLGLGNASSPDLNWT